MFQSPLGGVALLINIIIVSASLAVNKARGISLHSPLISQVHITKLKNHNKGKHIDRALTYIIPVFVLIAVITVSSKSFLYFYNDVDKVSVIDAALYAVDASKYTYTYLFYPDQITDSNDANLSTKFSLLNSLLDSKTYNETQQQALILQDKITQAAITNLPLITEIIPRQ